MSPEKAVRLCVKLNDYVTELEETVALMERSNFPFTDAAPVYSEVASDLRGMMDEVMRHEA